MTPIETLGAGAEGMSTAAELSTLKASVPIAGAAAEATTIGAVAPAVIGTIASTAFLIGGVFLVAKGVQATVTGKTPFRKTV